MTDLVPTQALPVARTEDALSRGGLRMSHGALTGFGYARQGLSHVLQPRNLEEASLGLEWAAARGLSVGLRGSGRSYGDAAINEGGLVLDLSRWNAVQDWDTSTGIARLDPGVRIRDLWRHIIVDGFWPKVVPGTMFPTMAGCAAMNIHGKNNYKTGTFGDHIRSFGLLTPQGEDLRCSREENAELFHAAIGGFGTLGIMHDIELQTHKVGSGRLEVEPISVGSLDEMFDAFEAYIPDADYCVGWIDAFASGASLGRGQIHASWYLDEDEDPAGAQMFALEAQSLPSRILGVFPKDQLWRASRLGSFPLGMRMVNLAKVLAGLYLPGASDRYRQSHAGYAFLLDYVPGWQWIYRPSGFIQFQVFVPDEHARGVIREILELQQRRGLVNWLTVLKRHRPDPFLLTHAVDGWSLAQDFKVTHRNRGQLWSLCNEMAELVLEVGGRFYPAKDAVLSPAQWRRCHGQETLDTFLALKQQVDPEERLQTNLYRRLFDR